MKDIKVIIATHKRYKMPESDMYIPIQVGKKTNNELGYQTDDVGENISSKNPYYCELTALYWGWKNLDADYMGLVHYRRYFSITRKIPKETEKKMDCILKQQEIENILDNVDIILPQKRNYYIETLYSHYKNTMYVEPLDETKKIIEEKYPEYLEEFDKLHRRTSGHMFNMFIMKKEVLNEYCTWIFDILFELEKRIDVTKYDSFHARFFGRVSELLLDVWINKNNLKYEEIKVISTERINWPKKILSFLNAKFLSKKYENSF